MLIQRICSKCFMDELEALVFSIHLLVILFILQRVTGGLEPVPAVK